MKTSTCFAGLVLIALIVQCSGPAFAWDTRWQFKQVDPANDYGSGPRNIEMQKKFDYNSMNTFKGTIDSSNRYTNMRNLNGGAMRGYIEKDGSGLLRDHNGKMYRVNTRW
jgi:hypothetical protein